MASIKEFRKPNGQHAIVTGQRVAKVTPILQNNQQVWVVDGDSSVHESYYRALQHAKTWCRMAVSNSAP